MLYPFNEFKPQLDPSVFIAASAILIGQVRVGARSSIWFNCVVRGDINTIDIGNDTNIQDGCLLHVTNQHPLTIGDRVTAGHGAIIHGSTVESDCMIAMGAVILDGAMVGKGSIIAAGCVVSPNMVIPEESLVMGIPGKVVRKVTAEDKARIKQTWQNYIGYGRTYQSLGLGLETT